MAVLDGSFAVPLFVAHSSPVWRLLVDSQTQKTCHSAFNEKNAPYHNELHGGEACSPLELRRQSGQVLSTLMHQNHQEDSVREWRGAPEAISLSRFYSRRATGGGFPSPPCVPKDSREAPKARGVRRGTMLPEHGGQVNQNGTGRSKKRGVRPTLLTKTHSSQGLVKSVGLTPRRLRGFGHGHEPLAPICLRQPGSPRGPRR